jgi:hypothetical protein
MVNDSDFIRVVKRLVAEYEEEHFREAHGRMPK